MRRSRCGISRPCDASTPARHRRKAPNVLIEQTALAQVLVLTPRFFRDERGFFTESYNKRAFAEAAGADVEFVQDNHSRSTRGVLRGLHYQLPPNAQGKLVRVAAGEIFDVAVDLRRSSPTFGRWFGSCFRRKRQPIVDPARLRPRLPDAQRYRGRPLQDERLLLARGRRRPRLGRSRRRYRVAADRSRSCRKRTAQRRGWPMPNASTDRPAAPCYLGRHGHL